ncbi:MAG: type II secretion system F family protein [Candidatus Omnitrophica bacterium]|nr:type II secretion system F family protein [Candidatus Omnitrophota bacterium]
MILFEYSAKDAQGKMIKGIVEANDRKAAVDILRKKNLIILSLADKKPAFSLATLFPFLRSNKIKTDDIVIFSRQMATVVAAGIPLVNALDIIGEQMEKPALRARIFKIRDDVEAGASLSEALGKDKDFFSSFFVNMIRAGETSGTLDEILERLAQYIEKSDTLQRKVKSAMVYPLVVSCMAVAVTMILMVKVIPVFKDIYAGFGAALPGPTQVLINVSDFLTKNIILIIGAVVGIVFGVQRYAATKDGRRRLDRMQLGLPIFGPLIRKVAVSKFTRTFSTLVRSGVPILNALDIVGKTAGNVIVEDAVENVKKNVREGENIAGPLSKTAVFPPMVVRMISIGEKTGQLEKMLTKIADFYDAQVDIAVTALSSLIEPLIIAFLGIVIGGIVACMFLPVLNISTVISGG